MRYRTITFTSFIVTRVLHMLGSAFSKAFCVMIKKKEKIINFKIGQKITIKYFSMSREWDKEKHWD